MSIGLKFEVNRSNRLSRAAGAKTAVQKQLHDPHHICPIGVRLDCVNCNTAVCDPLQGACLRASDLVEHLGLTDTSKNRSDPCGP